MDTETRTQTITHLQTSLPALMTREKFSELVGLPISVFIAQCERGYWPTVTVGRRCMVNAEAVRMAAAKKGEEFTL
jgi:hypothetical protein